MTSLGNIFDAVVTEGERGADLRWTVEVPRRQLGGLVVVSVPERFEIEGATVERAPSPDGAAAGDRVPLNLPLEVPDGATLRLRGQGGISATGGAPGDLYLEIVLVGPARPAAEREAMKAAAAAPEPAGQPAQEGGLLGWAAIAVAVALGALLVWMVTTQG